MTVASHYRTIRRIQELTRTTQLHDTEIARRVGVSPPTVARYRGQPMTPTDDETTTKILGMAMTKPAAREVYVIATDRVHATALADRAEQLAPEIHCTAYRTEHANRIDLAIRQPDGRPLALRIITAADANRVPAATAPCPTYHLPDIYARALEGEEGPAA